MIVNPIKVRVTRKTKEAQDIVSFELAGVDGASLPPFSAGAHIDVQVDASTTRQYSLCNDPAEVHRYVIGVLKDPDSRGGSTAMHYDVKQGDILQVSVPKNHFPLVPAKRTLLFGGGIGITPILCMAERLAQTGAEFELHYCTRSVERTAFYERILTSPFRDKVFFHFDAGASEQMLNTVDVLNNAGPEAHLYVCGPTGFIDHVTKTAKSLNWTSDRIHLEYFGAAPADTRGDAAFTVKIASSGMEYPVPADKTVVQALEIYGIEIPVSCEQGVCGTCVTRVLSGRPEHRDMYFTDDEHAKNDQFTPCCSRALSSPLVLDL